MRAGQWGIVGEKGSERSGENAEEGKKCTWGEGEAHAVERRATRVQRFPWDTSSTHSLSSPLLPSPSPPRVALVVNCHRSPSLAPHSSSQRRLRRPPLALSLMCFFHHSRHSLITLIAPLSLTPPPPHSHPCLSAQIWAERGGSPPSSPSSPSCRAPQTLSPPPPPPPPPPPAPLAVACSWART